MLNFKFDTPPKKKRTRPLPMTIRHEEYRKIEKFAAGRKMKKTTFAKNLLLTALTEYERQQK